MTDDATPTPTLPDAPESLPGDLAGPDLAHPAPPSTPARRGRLRAFLGILGPGLITGVADDDPSGVATYAQAGAVTGVQLLWLAPVSLPLMYGVQEICDRTALATGDSLGTLVRRKFGLHGRLLIGVLMVALLVANCLNIAADLAAIGQGMELLGLGPDHLWAAVAGVGLTIALVVGSFERIVAVFKWLCIVLVGYLGVLVVANVPWAEVGAGTLGLRMQWNWTTAGLIVAVLGTTISPYMFFWQSAHRIEEMRAEEGADAGKPLTHRKFRRAMRRLFLARIDTLFGMAVSVVIMFAIMVSTASTVGRDGSVTLNTAADAAQALAPIAGPAASVVFALGFIATGILAVPVLAASASIGLAGLLNKPWGFDHSPKHAPIFYGLLGLGTVGGIVIALLSNDPVGLLVLSAIINGIAAAPFIIVVMLVSGDATLMGRYRNTRLASVLGWLTAALIRSRAWWGSTSRSGTRSRRPLHDKAFCWAPSSRRLGA